MNTPVSIPADTAVTYSVTPRDPHAHLFDVCIQVRAPDPAGQVVSMPSWIPGSYLIRDFARHVVSIAAESAGVNVALKKLDKATWQAAVVSGELIIRAQIYANDTSVRGAYLDAEGGFLNASCLLPRVHGHDHERCVISIVPGDHEATVGWRLATSLKRLTGADFDYGAFEASGYDDLIDHPALMGPLTFTPFDAAGVEHVVALAGHHDADLDRLGRDLQALCAWHINFFGPPAPTKKYLFLVRLNGEGFGGLEHRASTALVCNRDDLPRHGEANPSAEYRRFLGLASHEYFHLWNIKRIRPAEFSPYRLDRESYTRQLWIFEGITSYYDDLALLRSDRITVVSYLELLGRLLTSVYRTGGRRRQTLEEASFDAWIKFYKPDENTSNSQISYYTKGAMVALALDSKSVFERRVVCPSIR